jgi:hypothetical protein
LIGGEAVVCSTSNQGNNCLELHTYMQNHITTFDTSVFEVVNGQINLTKICQHFHKRLDVWLKTKQTKAFLASYSVLTPNGGITVNIGNNGKEQGTFGNREIALKLAQWISPDFEVFCIQKLDELFQTGKTELNPKQINRKELALMVIAQEEELERLETENNGLKTALVETETLVLDTRKELEHKQSVIVDLSAKVPDEEMRTTINRVVKNYAKANNLVFPSVWSSLYTEFKYIYKLDLKTRAKHSGKSQLQEAEKAGKLEELYLLALKMYETEKVVATQATTEFEFIY